MFPHGVVPIGKDALKSYQVKGHHIQPSSLTHVDKHMAKVENHI